MKFSSSNPVKLVNKRSFVSAKGNNCTFLTIADVNTYENVDFMPVQGFPVDDLVVGNTYNAFVHCTGRFTSVELVPVK